MRTIEDLLGDVPALAALSPEHRATLAGCARNHVYAAGEYIFKEGDPATTFHAIREGAVALETFAPQRGPITIETLHDGDLLGWSWLLAPYRVAFDARALDTTHVMAFDGVCLRGKFDTDPALGYDLLRLFAAVIVDRLQQTRLRLLDVYGKDGG